MTTVEQAIRAAVAPGTRLGTASGPAVFEVTAVEREARPHSGLVLGAQRGRRELAVGWLGPWWVPSTQPSR